MSRITEHEKTDLIFEVVSEWCQRCLIGGKSLIWPDKDVWTSENLANFKKYFIDKPDTSKTSFEEKLKEQLSKADDNVTRLTCELLLIYFLFPTSVSRSTKIGLIRKVAQWKEIIIDENCPAFRGFWSAGIGNPGLAYNTRRANELTYLGQAAINIINKGSDERFQLLNNDVRLRRLLDNLTDAQPQIRHILLYLLFPDKYERIASKAHKAWISDAFGDLIGSDTPEDIDDRLKVIRTHLEGFLPHEELDFYWRPLRACWYTEGDSDTLSELQALHIKKQIVLYGPPGTGKTFQAREFAGSLIRQELLKAWGPKRYFSAPAAVEALVQKKTRNVQFHPGYGYEDFVRGIHIVEGGKTEYKDGILLQLIKEISLEPEEDIDIPTVLILDEMNRADLSKVLGECFSLLEDRDGSVTLGGSGGEPRSIRIPQNLYFIGTMNLIDQSLENIDFALRRRFLWFFRGFSPDEFMQVSEHRWLKLAKANNVAKTWDQVSEEFQILRDRAANVNKLIEGNDYLGRNYEIGHTYFCDAVAFAHRFLLASDGSRNRVLFNYNGDAIEPVKALWRYSLRPLLEQYLSGVDKSERNSFLDKIASALLSAPKP